MPTKTKKSLAVRRPRRSTKSNVIVKYNASNETEHLVDLKNSSWEEKLADKPELYPQTDPVVFKDKNWPFNTYRKIAITFIILAVLILGIIAYFAMVHLNIIVTPKVMPINANSTFTIYDRPVSFTLPANSVFGIVREMEVEYNATYPTTGGEVVGAEVSGIVTIINNYSKDQPLVATTRLLTKNNQLLRLKNTVLVPAGGSVEAEVYGDSVEPSFTLTDARLTIPGLWAGLQDKIYAEAKAGAVKYKEIRKALVSQNDLDLALTSAKQALIAKATADIEENYTDYDEKIYNLDNNSVSFSFDGKVGEAKDKITIAMTGKVMVVAFKKQDLINLKQTTLESNLTSGQTLIEDSDIKPSFKVKSADAQNNVAEIELNITGSSTTTQSEVLIDKQKLIGLSESQIKNYLDSLPNIASYELKFKPSFIKIAPQLVDRISIEIKN